MKHGESRTKLFPFNCSLPSPHQDTETQRFTNFSWHIAFSCIQAMPCSWHCRFLADHCLLLNYVLNHLVFNTIWRGLHQQSWFRNIHRRKCSGRYKHWSWFEWAKHGTGRACCKIEGKLLKNKAKKSPSIEIPTRLPKLLAILSLGSQPIWRVCVVQPWAIPGPGKCIRGGTSEGKHTVACALNPHWIRAELHLIVEGLNTSGQTGGKLELSLTLWQLSAPDSSQRSLHPTHTKGLHDISRGSTGAEGTTEKYIKISVPS